MEYCMHDERWPSYYQRRFLEFISYVELFPENHYNKILELGCGIGYQSAFLANFATEVIATDLPEEDMTTHSPGMTKAKILLQKLNIGNVEFLPCSAEDLPFTDNSFDMVYSSHVLEHIPDQQKALNEIYRVLKPGGIHFCVVPTSFEKWYSFLNYYLYLGRRSVHHLFKIISPSKKNNSTVTEQQSSPELKKAISNQLKYFPFPPPHGHSPHFLTEFKNWTPYKWRIRIENGAPFTLISQSSTQINPLLPILGGLFPVTGTSFHALTRKTERQLGKYKIFQVIGINTVLIFRK